MNFTNDKANRTPLQDNVFRIASLAKEDAKVNKDLVINATVGSLCDEDSKLATLDSVYESFEKIPDRVKASYSPFIKGDPEYLKSVYEWTLQGHASGLYHAQVATSGGTGAVSAALSATANEGDAILIPEIAWGSYKIMNDYFNLRTLSYPLFKDDRFDTESFEDLCVKTAKEQGRLTVIINDPCQNPTGYCMTQNEWERVVQILNKASAYGPVILVNDIAYIDYMHDLSHSRDHFDTLEGLCENVAVIVAFSCSKSLTSYGMRLGAAIILSKNEGAVKELEDVMERYARSVWSNVNNGFMNAFVSLMKNKKEEYLAQKDVYIRLLEKRAKIFTEEAKEAGLPCYPYKDGFFVTVKAEDPEFRDAYHNALMAHHIYTVKVNKGIRVALCSLNVQNAHGLANEMKKIAEEVKTSAI